MQHLFLKMKFLKSFFTTAPIAFPMIALFHLWLTYTEAVNYIGDTSVFLIYTLRPIVLLAYTIFWIGCCYMKRWAGFGYLVLTMLNVSFYLFAPPSLLKQAIGDILFVPVPINLLFCFLILFYFKRMQTGYIKPIKEAQSA